MLLPLFVTLSLPPASAVKIIETVQPMCPYVRVCLLVLSQLYNLSYGLEAVQPTNRHRQTDRTALCTTIVSVSCEYPRWPYEIPHQYKATLWVVYRDSLYTVPVTYFPNQHFKVVYHRLRILAMQKAKGYSGL